MSESIKFENGKFKILISRKSGIMSKNSLLVVRERTSYLRILGEAPSWELMTATASEDDGGFMVCSDRRRLIKTAILLCQELGLNAKEVRDRIGRDYVKICAIVREHHDEDLDGIVVKTVERFFELFDDLGGGGTGRPDDMIELYEAISSSGDMEDVYLSDGLWLSSNGSLHDRGR